MYPELSRPRVFSVRQSEIWVEMSVEVIYRFAKAHSEALLGFFKKCLFQAVQLLG